MKIFIVKVTNGCYDDREERTVTVTEDEEKAYAVLFQQTSEYNEIEIWENGELISSYLRGYSYIEKVFGKWERNFGKINERLEKS